jgi:patatin-like phospholipase/acyl hydrolase
MKYILQIDGGGLLGTCPARILKLLEAELKRPLCRYFDVMFGTSTGSIITGCLASGVPASKIHEFYLNDGPKLFTPRPKYPWNWFKSKYDKDPFYKKINEVVGDGYLSETRTNLTVTAYNNVSQRTHYLSNTSKQDENVKLVDAIAYSALSAAYYFGSYKLPEYVWTQTTHEGIKIDRKGAVFNDGGQGVNNCTLDDVLSMILANKWYEEGVYILSLGTGNVNMSQEYKKMADDGFLTQIIKYPFQARTEATYDQVSNARYVSEKNKNIIFRRLDYTLSKEKNELDKVEYINYYDEMGKRLFETMLDNVDFNIFRKKIP